MRGFLLVGGEVVIEDLVDPSEGVYSDLISVSNSERNQCRVLRGEHSRSNIAPPASSGFTIRCFPSLYKFSGS